MKLKGKEILIIDDDPQYRFLIQNILNAIGFIVNQATNYQDGIEMIKKAPPHLIICDINLGEDKTGLDVQRFLQKELQYSTIPIFIISSDASKATIFQALALGAKEYLLKPVAPKDLIQKIRRAFLDYESPQIDFLEESTGKYKTTLVNNFENDFDIEIDTEINLRAINELSCILQGPVKFPKGTVIDFENQMIKDIGGEQLGYRSIDNSRAIEAGSFSTRFSLVGIDEKTAQKIRAMRVVRK